MEILTKAIYKRIASVLWRVLFVVLSLLVAPTKALAAPIDTGGVINNNGTIVPAGDVATIKGFEGLFANFIAVIFEFAGIILFVMFIIAGFKFITSQGDPKALEGAKGTLTHAIIGLVVLVLAFVILVLIKTITGVDVTRFQVTH